nr:substrate-binding domain-containing protein [Robbsia andropogonis]
MSGCVAPQSMQNRLLRRMSMRLVRAPAGVLVGKLIAEGAVTLGFQQLADSTNVSGIAVLDPLPDDVQLHTVLSGAICRAAKHADVGRHFLSFLVSEPAIAVKRAFGMAPA